MRIVVVVLIFGFIVPLPASAEKHNRPAFDPNRLTGEPGVKMTQRKEGSVIVTVWSKNGVSITRTVDGSKQTVWGNDDSGKGAVICSWAIYTGARATLQACPGDFTELRSDLDQSIALIDDFIVANGLQSTTLEEIHAREKAEYVRVEKRVTASTGDARKLCTEGESGKMITYFNNISAVQRKRSIADLLSVQRWPVMNPCL